MDKKLERNKLTTTITDNSRLTLEKIKIKHKFKGINDSIEYLSELYEMGELNKNDNNSSRQECK